MKRLLSIRFRLILAALIFAIPLMAERIHTLESSRQIKLAQVTGEIAHATQQRAEAERQMLSSVEALLRTLTYIATASSGVEHRCWLLRKSLNVDLPWIASLSVIGEDGRITCSTRLIYEGLYVGDRSYLTDAIAMRRMVLSDLITSRANGERILVAAYPGDPQNSPGQSGVIATIDIAFIANLLNGGVTTDGVSTLLVDGSNTIVGSSPRRDDLLGSKLTDPLVVAEIADRSQGIFVTEDPAQGPRTVSFARIPGTTASVVSTIDEAALLGPIDASIRKAYVEIAGVTLLGLLAIWAFGEHMLVKPIRRMSQVAGRFAGGDLTTGQENFKFPTEFEPLMIALDAMAVQLADRERDLVNSNMQLVAMATQDVVSGLANRRGFQTQLNETWRSAQQEGRSVALVMIDVDHFKLFNDTYGHPEGDACLARVGAVIGEVARQSGAFASRYGGEEFCILVDGADASRAAEVADRIRAEIEALALPNARTARAIVTASLGVAATRAANGETWHALIEAADAALYRAKSAGRNAVAIQTVKRPELAA